MTAFNKIAVFSDIHFGEHGDSQEHNQYCVEFVEWTIKTAKERGCDSIAFLGDWHHHRNKVGAETLNYSFVSAQLLNDCGLKIYFVIGNHDLFYKDNRLIHSLPFLNELQNIKVINEPEVIGDSLFVPWLVTNDDLSKVTDTKVKYVFGHFELPHFQMNEHFVMPVTDHSMDVDVLKHPEYLFSGHFHKRQKSKTKNGVNIIYIGNCFPHSFSDVDDEERGLMILEYDKEPEFINWPDMPIYKKVLLSEYLENPDKYTPRTRLRIVQDVALTQSERTELRRLVTETYNISNVSIEPVKVEADISDLKIDLDNEENIDKVVLTFIQSQDYSSERLSVEKLTRLYMEN